MYKNKLVFIDKFFWFIIFLSSINGYILAINKTTALLYIFGTIIVPFIIFLIITNALIDLDYLSIFINLMITTGVILGLFSTYYAWFYNSFSTRISSLWLDYNIISGYFMIVFFFTLMKIIHQKLIIKRILLFVALIFISSGLMLTQTRSIYLATFLGILFYIIKKPKSFIYVLIFFGFVSIFFASIIIARLLTIANFTSDGASIGRLQAWYTSVILLSSNWLWGIGFDSFLYLRDNVLDYYIDLVVHSHNTYLRLWLELGLFGFISYIYFMVKSFYLTFKINKIKYLKSDIRFAIITDSIQLSFFGLFIAFIFEPYFSLYGNSTIIIWILISIVYRFETIYNEKNLAIV